MLCSMVLSGVGRMELAYTTHEVWGRGLETIVELVSRRAFTGESTVVFLGHQWIERRALKDVTWRFENICHPRLASLSTKAQHVFLQTIAFEETKVCIR